MIFFISTFLLLASAVYPYDREVIFSSGFIQSEKTHATTHSLQFKFWEISDEIDFKINTALNIKNESTTAEIEEAYVTIPLFSYTFQNFSLSTGRFFVNTTKNNFIPAYGDIVDGFKLKADNVDYNIQIIFDALLKNPRKIFPGEFTEEPEKPYFRKSNDSYRLLCIYNTSIINVKTSALTALTFYGNDAIHNRDFSGNGLWGSYSDNDHLINGELMLTYTLRWFKNQASEANVLMALSQGEDKKLSQPDINLSGQSLAMSLHHSFHRRYPQLILFFSKASNGSWENNQQRDSGFIRLPGRRLREIHPSEFSGYTAHFSGIFYDAQLSSLMNYLGGGLEHKLNSVLCSFKFLFANSDFSPLNPNGNGFDYMEISGKFQVSLNKITTQIYFTTGKSLNLDYREQTLQFLVKFKI